MEKIECLLVEVHTPYLRKSFAISSQSVFSANEKGGVYWPMKFSRFESELGVPHTSQLTKNTLTPPLQICLSKQSLIPPHDAHSYCNPTLQSDTYPSHQTWCTLSRHLCTNSPNQVTILMQLPVLKDGREKGTKSLGKDVMNASGER
jgi:hypothetical protein